MVPSCLGKISQFFTYSGKFPFFFIRWVPLNGLKFSARNFGVHPMFSFSISFLSSMMFLLWAEGTHADTAYISVESGNEVAVVAVPEGKVTSRIKAGKRPRGLMMSPDQQSLFVAVSDEHTIKQFDLTTKKVVASLPSGRDPETFVISPDGKRLYASNEDDSMVTVVDIEKRKAIKEIKVGVEPEGICTSPDGQWVVSTSETTNMAHWINTASLSVVDNTPVDPRPRACSFTQDGKQLWVSSEIAGSVTVLDSSTRQPLGRITFSVPGVTQDKLQPVGIQIDKDRKWAYVALGPANRIAVINAQTFAVKDYWLVGQRIWNITFGTEEKYLYAANGVSNDLSIINLLSRKVEKSIPVGLEPWGVAIAP